MAKRYLGGGISFEQKDVYQEFSEDEGGGGSSTLAGLTDVDISNPTDGQTLVFNATSGKWENGAAGGGVRVVSVNSVTEFTPASQNDPPMWVGTLDITAGDFAAAFTGTSVSPIYIHIPEFGLSAFFSYDFGVCPVFLATRPLFYVSGADAFRGMNNPLQSFEVFSEEGGLPTDPLMFEAYGLSSS